ncbi:hypothetical protein PanWU01x14_248390 [Parasponia andersonii]|uniref:Uncharacterized protein n=1 Tax=Parasponia andersonii TaxID=3476 RepID=A0A2P5BDI6_PARAD|nr:hypothetical protein PanWU01x14_248390 [Parasponia andersonii]
MMLSTNKDDIIDGPLQKMDHIIPCYRARHHSPHTWQQSDVATCQTVEPSGHRVSSHIIVI